MNEVSRNWPKKITVDKRIITILSGSTYNNFPKALKEIITNSYDADASEVRVSVDVDKETITVEDNGIGMSENDFDFYLRIAGKSRSTREYTLAGRKRVGQFGVGFLSVFPFCRTYNIESTKKGSAEVIFASIPNYKFVEENQKISAEIEEIPIQGGRKNDPSQINRQFTKIKLVGFTRLAKDFFKHAYQVSNRRETILNYSPLKRLEWELCEDLPIEFDSHNELTEKLSEVYDSLLRERSIIVGTRSFLDKFSNLLRNSIKNSLPDNLILLNERLLEDKIETMDNYQWYRGILYKLKRVPSQNSEIMVLLPWAEKIKLKDQGKKRFIIERGINIYSRGSSLTPEEMNDILEKASSYLLDDVIDFIENNNARKYR